MGNQSSSTEFDQDDIHHNHHQQQQEDDLNMNMLLGDHLLYLDEDEGVVFYDCMVPKHIRDCQTTRNDSKSKTQRRHQQTITTFQPDTVWALSQGQIGTTNTNNNNGHTTLDQTTIVNQVQEYLHESALRLEQLRRRIQVLKTQIYGQQQVERTKTSTTTTTTTTTTATATTATTTTLVNLEDDDEDDNDTNNSSDNAEDDDDKQEAKEEEMSGAEATTPSPTSATAAPFQQQNQNQQELLLQLQEMQQRAAEIALQRQDVQQVSILLVEATQTEELQYHQGLFPPSSKRTIEQTPREQFLTQLEALRKTGLQQLETVDV